MQIDEVIEKTIKGLEEIQKSFYEKVLFSHDLDYQYENEIKTTRTAIRILGRVKEDFIRKVIYNSTENFVIEKPSCSTVIKLTHSIITALTKAEEV